MVGGMVFDRLWRLAIDGYEYDVEVYRYTVTAVDGRRVAQVKAKKLAPRNERA